MLKIINEHEVEIERKYLSFRKANVNKIAYAYDAKIVCWQPDIKHAVLKDSKGRLIWVEGIKDGTCNCSNCR